MAFMKMVEMSRSPAEKAEEAAEMMAPPSMDMVGDYPPGLCLCFNEETLEKLDLEDDCEVGDMIDIRAMGIVTSVSKNGSLAGGSHCRIEIQLTHIAVENEEDEYEEENGEEDEYEEENGEEGDE